MNRITDTVKHLLILNVIFFVGTLALGEGTFFYEWFSMYFPKNPMFKPWQIISHMFMHGGFMHIGFNMLALWMFGTPVEQRLDNKKFLFLYFSAGLGALALQVGFSYFNFYSSFSLLNEAGFSQSDIMDALSSGYNMYDKRWENVLDPSQLESFVSIYNTPMVGASGAIMGILVAFGMMYPESKLMLIFLPVPIKAKYFIPGIIILDLVSALTGQSFFSPSNTAYMAHVGGALTGFIIMWFWRKTQFNKNRWDL
jgi:membrane associated rhomboid family serine protease